MTVDNTPKAFSTTEENGDGNVHRYPFGRTKFHACLVRRGWLLGLRCLCCLQRRIHKPPLPAEPSLPLLLFELPRPLSTAQFTTAIVSGTIGTTAARARSKRIHGAKQKEVYQVTHMRQPPLPFTSCRGWLTKAVELGSLCVCARRGCVCS